MHIKATVEPHYVPARMGKAKRLSTPGGSKDGEQLDPHAWLVGTRNGAASLKTWWAMPHKVQQRAIVQPHNLTPGCDESDVHAEVCI